MINSAPRKGRLKIYLGMAAGVGKTYAMLSDALEDRDRGLDIVAGYVEPHGRRETEQLVEGLESIPTRTIDHRGVSLREFDLDSAITRHPQVLLVDELAHSNVPGSRHEKRWQDVSELLEAGIDVRTTLNIQHIESLRDVVAQLTGVFVQETVPDAIIDRADEIELVDLPPEELHQRLREGKVYVPEKIDQALTGFFKKGNLLGLRELALRTTARRVDEDRRRHDPTPGVLRANERIMVCLAPNRMAPRLVRAARQLASDLHSELIAVSVNSLRQAGASEQNQRHLDLAMGMAESLGARTASLSGEDIVAEIVRFARTENVTTIIVGKPIRPRWREMVFGSVVDSLIRASGDIDVHVITAAEEQGTSLITRPSTRKPGWQGYAFAAALVAVSTGIGFAMFSRLDLANIVMVYLLAVAITSVRYGRRESIFAAVFGVASFDICFVNPRGTFAVTDVQYLVTFAIMLAVSLIITSLTTRLKAQSLAASSRERNTAALYELSRKLATARKREDMAAHGAEMAAKVANAPVAVLVQGAVLTPSSSRFEEGASEGGAAAWVLDNGRPAGRGTGTLAGARGLYLPLAGSGPTLGVLAIDLLDAGEVDMAKRHTLEAIASQLAGALERAVFARQSHEAALQNETERLRSDLLSAVSHDLRTPLASIEGMASVLASQKELPDESREFAQTIMQQSRRMERMVNQLLDMTRVQGEVVLNLDWYGLEELIANAVDRTKGQFTQPVSVIIKEPIVTKVDGVLIEQVLVNLLENASRHAGSDAHVGVTLKRDGNVAVIQVSDNGPGIPEGREQSIFDRFARGGEGGFGLGLAICKAAAEAHGGTISAQNQPAGGALFTVRLPINEA
jgi:two-component system sensor histidine kinase KdpD